jgi:hypothetical protein
VQLAEVERRGAIQMAQNIRDSRDGVQLGTGNVAEGVEKDAVDCVRDEIKDNLYPLSTVLIGVKHAQLTVKQSNTIVLVGWDSL